MLFILIIISYFFLSYSFLTPWNNLNKLLLLKSDDIQLKYSSNKNILKVSTPNSPSSFIYNYYNKNKFQDLYNNYNHDNNYNNNYDNYNNYNNYNNYHNYHNYNNYNNYNNPDNNNDNNNISISKKEQYIQISNLKQYKDLNIHNLDITYTSPIWEINALYSLYNSLNGKNWFWSSNTSLGIPWNFNSLSPQPCLDKWQRITCYCIPTNGLCIVVQLDLSEFNLNGTISSNIKYLSQLVYLNMANNTLLHGSIPKEIGSLTNLIYLSMYITHLTGTIPNELQNLVSLKYIIFGQVIDFNAPVPHIKPDAAHGISGNYPSFLSSLPNLLYIYLYNTHQTGTIPESWSKMSKLLAIVLGGTYITGTLPKYIVGNLTKTKYFIVGTSALTGTIPLEISNLISCETLALNTNNFISTIPSIISKLTNLQYLYLQNNKLNGTFPEAITYLTKLNYLYLNNNQLTGTIPYKIADLTNLTLASLSLNYFQSTIPPEIGLLSSLESLDLSLNCLVGTLPSSINSLKKLKLLNLTYNNLFGNLNSLNNLTLLQSLSLSSNQFTSTLSPSIFGNFNNLEFLQLNQNKLTGIISSWIGNLKSLICIDLSNNKFIGSIPSILSQLNNSLIYLDLSLNSFTNTIPNEITYLTSLQYLIIENSNLQGTIPFNIGKMISLQSLRLKKNNIQGIIPSSIGKLIKLNVLDLSENLLTSSLPSTFNHLKNLQYLLIHNNNMKGNLKFLVNSSIQLFIKTIDISDNTFTGTIPNEIYQITSLQHFAAVVNCLHGSLQTYICNSQSLEVLALDGIGSANICQIKYFGWSNSMSSYGLKYGLSGTIPNCIFEMKNLKSLHLSGNKITGSISNSINISNSLIDISVSHNLLTGSIPINIQERVWDNLDLSFNKFYGSLSSNFANYPTSSSLRLLVNRLSGRIPISIQEAYNVSVLDGNLFECNVYNGDKGLPKHDSATGVYQCADSFQQLSYTWISPYIFFVIIALLALFIFSIWKSWSDKMLQFAENIDKYMIILDKQFITNGRTSSILLFKKFVVDWQITCLFISIYNLLFMLPIWIILTIFYNTYQFEYSWSASVAYLSGLTPSLVALITFSFLLGTVFSLSTTNTERHKSRRTSNFVAIVLPESKYSILYHYTILFLIIIFNCAIVIGVNVLYVMATNRYNKTIVTFCALAVALFKFIWNLVTFTIFEKFEKILKNSNNISSQILQKYQHRNLIIQSIIGLINNILIPLLSTSAVSSTCYYYFFQSSKPITAIFKYSECIVQTILVYTCSVHESVTACNNFAGVSYQCLGDNEIERSTSFNPPFNYSYQCSSTFIASYAAVYVYSYLMVAIVGPGCTFLLVKLRSLISNNSSLLQIIDILLPKYMIPVTTSRKITGRLFNKNRFVTYAITDTAVLITFGGIFPPLSFVICIAIFTRAFYILFFLGRMLSIADELNLSEYSEQLLQDCADVPEIFSKLLWLILPFAALIFSLFIFDTYGDEVTWKKAFIPALVMCFIPLLFYLLRYIYKRPEIKPTIDKCFDWCRKHIPFAKVLLKSRPQDIGLRASIIVSQSTRLSVVTFRGSNSVTPITPSSKHSNEKDIENNQGSKITNKSNNNNNNNNNSNNNNNNNNNTNMTNEKKSNIDEEYGNNNIVVIDDHNTNNTNNNTNNSNNNNNLDQDLIKEFKLNQKEDEFRIPTNTKVNQLEIMEISEL